MRLASFATAHGASYGLVVDDGIVDLRRHRRRTQPDYPDLKALLAGDDLAEALAHLDRAPDYRVSEVDWKPVLPNPDKIICVGLNYEDHRAETAQKATTHPALFLRTAESQVGHRAPILRPRESSTLDYEAEVAVVIGKPGRRIPADRSWDHVAGYACYDDGSVREWQRHTQQYTAGKNFAHTGGFGPWMVTADEIPPGTVLTLSCRVNGELRQHASTDQMIFSIPELIAYVSSFTTLLPGDVIVTGTPGGVGARRQPPVWLKPGDKVEVEIDRVGVLENDIADE